MGYEIREIDSGDSGEFICSPDLEVSGTGVSEATITEFTANLDGYTRKDSIVKMKLDTSIIGDDDVYSLPLNNLYEFSSSDGSIANFDIIEIEEDSGVSVISVYGRTKELTNFFGSLSVSSISGYTVSIGVDLKVSQKDKCKKPVAIKFFNVTTSSISATLPGVDYNFVYKWVLRYRVKGQTTWNQLESTTPIIEVTGLTSGSLYEADASVYCTEHDYSVFSETSDFLIL